MVILLSSLPGLEAPLGVSLYLLELFVILYFFLSLHILEPPLGVSLYLYFLLPTPINLQFFLPFDLISAYFLLINRQDSPMKKCEVAYILGQFFGIFEAQMCRCQGSQVENGKFSAICPFFWGAFFIFGFFSLFLVDMSPRGHNTHI